MTRNLKVLGLAFVAVFAMSAIAASAAQASAHIGWAEGTTTLTGHAAAVGGTQAFTTTAGTITCNEIFAKVETAGYSNPTSTIETSELKYDNNGTGNCPSNLIGFEPKIEMNGCNYLFHLEETDGEEMTVSGTADVVCPAGAFIKINGGAACTVYVGSQTGIHITAHTVTPPEAEPEDVLITANTGKVIKYHHEGLCGKGEGEDGSYVGNTTVTGETSKGVRTAVTVT